MDMNEFISSLDLPYEGEQHGPEYIINLDSSNEFSEVFNKISLINSLSLDGDSTANDDESLFRYTDGYYEVVLAANYDEDVYTVTISEK